VTTRKGKLRPARRRTSETVVRTHVVVITAHAEGGRVASTRPEVDLIKAAILYADSVEVLSLGNQLIRSLDGHASGLLVRQNSTIATWRQPTAQRSCSRTSTGEPATSRSATRTDFWIGST